LRPELRLHEGKPIIPPGMGADAQQIPRDIGLAFGLRPLRRRCPQERRVRRVVIVAGCNALRRDMAIKEGAALRFGKVGKVHRLGLSTVTRKNRERHAAIQQPTRCRTSVLRYVTAPGNVGHRDEHRQSIPEAATILAIRTEARGPCHVPKSAARAFGMATPFETHHA